MKATNYFTRTILTYLEQRATTDTLFAEAFANPDKSVDDCVCYILNTVQKSGCNGFADDEIYSMAVDFYNNDNVEVGKRISCKMVVNHVVELTQEEKEQARQDAIQKAQNEIYKRVTQQKKKITKQPEVTNQLSLF